MIDRLPLEIFGGESEPDANANPASPAPALDADADIVVQPAGSDAEPAADLAHCQMCGGEFDDALEQCPHCGATYLPADQAPEESSTVTCQWCLTEFESNRVTCPSCNARVVIPGQYVPGLNDPMPDYASRGMLPRYTEANRYLVGMMAGGGLDTIAAGLIGLALTLFDDD